MTKLYIFEDTLSDDVMKVGEDELIMVAYDLFWNNDEEFLTNEEAIKAIEGCGYILIRKEIL